ncbi:hypothetical protein C9427_31845 [Mesorhizobium helmanticense]|uniref:Uncharacterized protein n=1 Tax=Mesorhizobium helmanticense TaxID=1776423 RepID=A0A2T4ILA3_9HYPH|nr:hypothetical protein C9427_31845 [Mesorhizobium helmanticense]
MFARGRPPDGTTRAAAVRSEAARRAATQAPIWLTSTDRCFLDLDNNFAILIHWDGFAPALDAVTRIVRDDSRLFNSTAHEIDFAECSSISSNTLRL